MTTKHRQSFEGDVKCAERRQESEDDRKLRIMRVRKILADYEKSKKNIYESSSYNEL